MKHLYPKKLTYKLTTSWFTKLFVCHLVDSFLGYTIYEGMVEALFMIVLLGEAFPMVSLLTQTKIVS